MQRRAFLRAAGLAATGGLGGCLAPNQPAPVLSHAMDRSASVDSGWRAPRTAPATDVTVVPVIDHLEIPWDVAFAPNGDLFVTERVGRVNRISHETLSTVVSPAEAIDADAQPPGPDDEPFWDTWFLDGGEGGVLGVAVHPLYPDPAWLYVYYTAATGVGKHNRVVMYDLDSDDPAGTARIVIGDIPADSVHNGGRIQWGPDNYLWVTTGDAGDGANAQDERSLGGKVLRVQANGTPAHDNPAIWGRDRRIYTLGHRNPQGIAWLPDGTPLLTEHGPNGYDELNVLEPGANYGWPHVRTPAEYVDAATEYPRPLLSTGESSWAPTGATFYTGDGVPSWSNRLIVGQLFGQRLGVATLTPPGQAPPPGDVTFDADWLHDDYTVTVSHVLSTLGRIRGAFQGPDGALYAITSNRDGRARGEHLPRPADDRIVRIVER